jgi:hypothetical protein
VDVDLSTFSVLLEAPLISVILTRSAGSPSCAAITLSTAALIKCTRKTRGGQFCVNSQITACQRKNRGKKK